MKVSENKPHSIHLRLTEEQYKWVSGNALTLGVGNSDFLRMVVNSLMVTSERISTAKLGDLYANEKDNQ